MLCLIACSMVSSPSASYTATCCHLLHQSAHAHAGTCPDNAPSPTPSCHRGKWWHLHNEREPCFGGLLANPTYSARFAVFSVLPESWHRLAPRWSRVLHCPYSTGCRTTGGGFSASLRKHRDVIWFVGSCNARRKRSNPWTSRQNTRKSCSCMTEVV